MIYVLDEREITTSTTTIRATHRRVAHINDSRGEARDNRGIYAALVSGLGGVPRFHTAALIAQTMDHLAAEKHERGRSVIVAVDEAHLLTADQLEELRLLTLCRARGYAEVTTAASGSPWQVRGSRPGRSA